MLYCYSLVIRSDIGGIDSAPTIVLVGKSHYSGVIMSSIASQITSLTMFTQQFIQAQIKENIKAPRHWLLWREYTGDRKKDQ